MNKIRESQILARNIASTALLSILLDEALRHSIPTSWIRGVSIVATIALWESFWLWLARRAYRKETAAFEQKLSEKLAETIKLTKLQLKGSEKNRWS